MESQAPYHVAFVATPATCAADALAEALAAFTAQAQALADAARPGLGIALSIDTLDSGPHFFLATIDPAQGRSSYLHRTAVGSGFTPAAALSELRTSLGRQYADNPDEADHATDAAMAYAKEAA